MKPVAANELFTVEAYIAYEWTAQQRHEFINGQLFEMPGEKDINNEMAGLLYILLVGFLKAKGYNVYNHDVKVGIPNEAKYYYPDVFVTKEPRTDNNIYIKYEPELIVEVVSESTQINDYVDKYISYTKIPSLQYYIIVEPETTLITLYARENGEFVTHKYTNTTDIITLPHFGISFWVKDVYSI
jgi:Uma2 family endonuclease